MPQVEFFHPNKKGEQFLPVVTGANQISWGFGLNTQTFPTYGGEVVQILSTYTDTLTISGDCRDYKQVEHLYKWFIEYFAVATQASGPNFDATPVTFRYPERGWELKIQPSSIPQFAYGTDVVAPSWQMQAYVVEDDPNMAAFTMQQATIAGFNIDSIHAGIGYDDNNPFSDPAANPDLKTKKQEGKNNEPVFDPMPHLNDIADFYNNLLGSYIHGEFNFSDYQYLFSKPAQLSQESGASGASSPNTNLNTQ